MATTSLRSGVITVNGEISMVDNFLCILEVSREMGATCIRMWNVHCTMMSSEN